MMSSKRGVEGYIVVVIAFSFVISLLLFAVIEIAYESDAEVCNMVSYELEVKCQQPSGYQVYVENIGNQPVAFEIDGETSDEYVIGGLEDKTISILSNRRNSQITPIAFSDEQSHYCLADRKRTNLEVLPGC